MREDGGIHIKKGLEKLKKGRFGLKIIENAVRNLYFVAQKWNFSDLIYKIDMTDGLDHPPISVEVTTRGYSAQSPIIRELYVPIHLCKGSISSDFLRLFK